MKDRLPPEMASLGFGISVKRSAGRKDRHEPAAVPSRSARILVVDNDPGLRRLMTIRLGAANYQVLSADSAQAAINACTSFRPDLVITDLRMEPMDGLELLNELKRRWPDLGVIILTAHGTIPEAVRATQCGAFGFLVKPIDKSELLGQVQRAIAASSFTHVKGDWRADIVSRSQLMEDRLGQANRAARSEVPVMLSGDAGTGKELFARAIHAASARRDKPFVAVSCGTLGEAALESALFGFGRDAGDEGRGAPMGVFEQARGGTLLLDEIGELPFRLQVRLVETLRQDRELGDVRGAAAQADVRLICATSHDLKEMTKVGRFHDDLYYRVNVLPIEVPPLGRRREDIPLLVSSFLEQAGEEGSSAKIYSPQAVQLLVTADWPGNVRQLFDLVKQNVALSPDRVMTEEFVEKSLGKCVGKSPEAPSAQLHSYDDARDEFLRNYLAKNLESTSGNVSRSARIAKRNRTDFYKLLSRYRLQPGEYKKNRLGTSKKALKTRN